MESITTQDITGALFMLFVLTLMIFLSEITGEKEIIFPEVAAICVGSFLTPKVIWKSNYFKIVISIALCAIAGVLIVLFIPLPLWGQFSIAYALAQWIFFFSGTGFAPMISAMVLPVLIQTKSYIYIVSAILLTVLVMTLTYIYQKWILREEKIIFQKISPPWKEFSTSFIFRTIYAIILSYGFTSYEWRIKFCIAPPLLVAFTELTTNRMAPPAKKPFTSILLFTVCAFTGSLSRYVLTIKCHLPLTFSAFVTTIGIIIIMKRIIKLYFPPAAAMGILASLIPEEVVLYYFLEVAAGITLLIAGALFWRRILWGNHNGNQEPTKEPNMSEKNKSKDEKSVQQVEIVIDEKAITKKGKKSNSETGHNNEKEGKEKEEHDISETLHDEINDSDSDTIINIDNNNSTY